MKGKKKGLDFEINLLAFIGLLAVCVCFLLLTAIWVHIGSMDVKQAIGGQPAGQSKVSPKVWVKMMSKGRLEFRLHNAPRKTSRRLHRVVIKGLEDEKPDFEKVLGHVKNLKEKIPDLEESLIMPYAQAKYEDIIHLMDYLKEGGMTSLGVSPL